MGKTIVKTLTPPVRHPDENERSGLEEAQVAFIAAYIASGGRFVTACRAINRPPEEVYLWRDTVPAFKRVWDEAGDKAGNVLEDEAIRRAVEGVVEPIYGSLGTIVGERTRYSDRLLIYLLKGFKPDKYGDKSKVEVSGPGDGPVRVTSESRLARLAEIIGASRSRRKPVTDGYDLA